MGKKKEEKNGVNVDMRERVERNGNQLQTKTFRYFALQECCVFLEYLQNYTHNKSSKFLLEQRKDREYFPANFHSLYGANVK